jgi:hypothetical protein
VGLPTNIADGDFLDELTVRMWVSSNLTLRTCVFKFDGGRRICSHKFDGTHVLIVKFDGATWPSNLFGLRGLRIKFDGTHELNVKNVGTHVLNPFPEKNKNYRNEKLDKHNITCNTEYHIQYRFQTHGYMFMSQIHTSPNT